MQINRTSSDQFNTTISKQGTQPFSSAAPADAANRLGQLFSYWDPNKAETIEKPAEEYFQKLKSFDHVTGYFDFYFNEKSNTTLLEIKPDQLNKMFLLSAYRVSGSKDESLDADIMMGNYPVYFKRVGDRLQFYRRKTDARSRDINLNKAVEKSENDTMIASSKISMINADNGNIVVDLKDLLVVEADKVLSHRFMWHNRIDEAELNKEDSYIEKPKSFSKNSEIKATVAFSPKDKDNNPKNDRTDNLSITYNFSFSEIPESDYRPRLNDPRVGYFTNGFDDCDKVITEERRVEYINRWDLGRIDLKTGKPEKPIVFWVANTVSKKYKEAVKKGILAWNEAFKEIGINEAIQVNMQPDDADWDPSDIRYNTVNFVHLNTNWYSAIGPSMSNPFTGEIYAADIAIGYDSINYGPDEIRAFDENYQKLKDEKAKQEYIDKSILDRLTSLTFHEVGHTLGLRHNFKGSLRSKDGVPYSIMDYNPEDDGAYQLKPGEYDKKAIEYGYKPIYTATEVEEEKNTLDLIVKDMYDKKIPYGTDEDLNLDPSCNTGDAGNPLKYCSSLIERTKNYWKRFESDFEKKGVKYEKFRDMFYKGFGKITKGLNLASEYIGGVYYNRGNIGDLKDKTPYEPVPGKEQKEAVKFLLEEVLNSNLYNFSPKFANKINMNVKQTVGGMQRKVLDKIFSPDKLKRISDNELRYNKKEDAFKLTELFEEVEKSIGSELDSKKEIKIGDFRQKLQKFHIEKLHDISKGKYHEEANDAAKESIKRIKSKIAQALSNAAKKGIKIDKETMEHLKEMIKLLDK
ncbi:MAG: zinc-dependent metalloprotease [Armatimonadota bacterium]